MMGVELFIEASFLAEKQPYLVYLCYTLNKQKIDIENKINELTKESGLLVKEAKSFQTH